MQFLRNIIEKGFRNTVQMNGCLEVLSGFVTAPSSTLTALTMGSGDRLQIRPFNAPRRAFLLTFWSDHQTAGSVRIKSPNMHDFVNGIRAYSVASEVSPLLLSPAPQELYSQDTLTVETDGSATAGDIESVSLLVYYEEVNGLNAKLITPYELKQRTKSVLTVQNTLATGTAGGYSGEESIVAETDVLKPNTNYAIIGANVSAECCTIGYRSSDFGNLRVGIPGNETKPELTNNWFVWLSNHFNLPLIPVFNSASKNSVLLDAVQDENGTDVLVSTNLVELS